ncbi:MAG: DNA translocase FtsK [Anaerolineae bacterium]|nr:DNA translocase FtsK [Anaerolineae bacterium]MDW8069068.1 DNA translocase FtsK [Anaerolineae bacterium]
MPTDRRTTPRPASPGRKPTGGAAPPSPRRRWWSWLTGPVAQQVLAVGLILLSLLTFLTLLRITSGRWTDAWLRTLQLLFGWGAVPVAFAIGWGGVLILQHHLERPVPWRWRPVVGLELLFFGLLALTHLLLGRRDPWALVQSGWGGGMVGWALAHILSLYLGPLVAGVLLAIFTLLGLGLAMDWTLDDVREWLRRRRSPSVPARSSVARPTRPAAPAASRPAAPAPADSSLAPSEPPALAPPPRPAPVSPPSRMAPETVLPPLDLLDEGEEIGLSDEEIRRKSRIIVETLAQFGLPVQVVEVRRGPAVTQFGIAPGFTERPGPDGQRRPHKVRVSQIAALADDLALALAAPSLRVEAPVPGRSVVGIEVPNDRVSRVSLRAVMESEAFAALRSPLAIALGEDVAGSPVVADLSTMPHLLIAGTTGSGKSICIKSIATCLAMTNRPDQLRFVMIDPKMVELVHFNGLPHLLGHTEVELERIARVLRWVAHEMDERYRRFAAAGARHIDDYNEKVGRSDPSQRMPRIVVLIDELADLMMLAPEETERTICRIAQMARATGIHLVVATQRPSVDVVTGLIKANFPARISFATASQVDSRVILDMPGAETLLGKGDMLYLAADAGHPVRLQGCYVSEAEIQRVVDFWRQQWPGWVSEAPWESMMPSARVPSPTVSPQEEDDLLQQAIAILRTRETISASYLQRRLRIAYPTAARLMERLEEMGLVGPPEAAGRPRRVIGGE